MNLGRRDVLKLALGSAALAAGWKMAANPAAIASASPHAGITHNGIKNTLIALGVQGHRHRDVLLGKIETAVPSSPSYFDRHSVITELDIQSGKVKQSAIPIADAHSAIRLPNGNLLITSHHRNTSILIDENHQFIKRILAPKGYLYGGHSRFLPQQNVAIVPARFATPKGLADTGLIMAHDPESFEVIGQYSSGGIHPHEIRVLPNQSEFVITHYGDIKTPHPKGLEFHVIEPKLSVYDLQTFAKKRDYVQPIDGIYTHMDIGIHGDVYAVSNQYVAIPDRKADAINALLQKHNLSHDLSLSFMSSRDSKLAIPSAVIKVNPQTGEREEFLVSEAQQLRSQSVAAHMPSKRIFATFVFSNTLVMIDEATRAVSAIDAFKYGMQAIRGVGAIPNSDYIAISDQERGIAIVNAYTLDMVQQFSPQIFLGTHIDAV